MSIRIRSGYSFRKAVGKLPDVMNRIKEIGLNVAPLTDTASAFGWRQWGELCDKNEIRPVYGVEIAVSEKLQSKGREDHWTFIAKDDLKPLHHLIMLASQQRERITLEQAMEVENVFKVVGHRSDLELIDPQTPDLAVALSPSVSTGYFRLAQIGGFKWVAASDNRFPLQSNQGLYEVVAGGWQAMTQTYPQHILNDQEWASAVLGQRTEQQAAIALRDEWFGVSTARMQIGKLVKPDRPATLRQMCIDGAKQLQVNLENAVYSKRLDRELSIIAEKDFEDYFYIIADLVTECRRHMLVGPARGSSCGSLVCYLLGITTVDPIKYDLIFERFIDINRPDLPDIDIDFADNRRDIAFEYMMKRYKPEHVARLGTVTMYKPTSALKEAAGALNIPPWDIEPVVNAFTDGKNVIRNTLTLTDAGSKLLAKFPNLIVAADMEDHPRHFSQHAAGMIITDKPVSDYVALDWRVEGKGVKRDDDEVTGGGTSGGGSTHCDKRDAEALNLLKIDALGLKQLSIFQDALDLAKLPVSTLEKIDLTDPASIDILNERKFTGIFQFDGKAVQNVAEAIRINDLEDMIAITSLARPGPLNSGGAARWIERKNGNSEVQYFHPLFEPILSNTLGVVTYQEQVMRIGREVAGMDWKDVTNLRKAIAKSMGKEHMKSFADQFIPGAVANGVPLKVAEKVWDELCENGAYLFNRSHAVAYSIISFQCCWLKAHHPVEFAAATLNHTDSDEQKLRILRELDKEGVGYKPFDRDFSKPYDWTVSFVGGKKFLTGPLTNIVGVGTKMAKKIDAFNKARQEQGLPCEGNVAALPKQAEKLLTHGRSKLASLYPIKDRIFAIDPDLRKTNITTEPTKVVDIKTTGYPQHGIVTLVVIADIKQVNENGADKVNKRGYEFNGPTAALNLWIEDDTDKVFAKINRFDFEKIATQIMQRGRPGKSLWALKGDVPKNFRMLDVKMARYIGDIEENWNSEEGRRFTKEETNLKSKVEHDQAT